MKKALLIIDMLNDFLCSDGALYVEGSEKIIDRIEKEREKSHKEGVTVIYLCDSHRKDDPEFKIWPEHCVKGTYGVEIINELKPDKDDIIINKTTYSGFYNTELEKTLKEKGIEKLLLTGVATNICVLYTAADARMRGFKVEVLKDAVEGLTPRDKEWALRQMKEVLLAELK